MSVFYNLAHNPEFCLDGIAHELWVILILSGVEHICQAEMCLLENLAGEQSRYILKANVGALG